MLSSPDRILVVSNIGWADKSSLWTYDVVKDSVNLIPLGFAKYLSLYPCKDPNQFAVLHHSEDAYIRLSVHAFDNPAVPICTIGFEKGNTRVEGDTGVLQNAPGYYVIFYNPGHDADYQLVSVDTSQNRLLIERFAWFDSSYDKDYQGVIGVVELPSGELIISVQRDSHPIVYDTKTRQVKGKLTLANRYGNPKFCYLKQRNEVWADDYDTLIKFRGDDLTVKNSQILQLAPKGKAQFIGNWSFNEDETLCLVSRPFSGDIVAISTDNMKIKYAARTGRQPIQSAFLNNDRVIGRDWKTGILIMGLLERKWF